MLTLISPAKRLDFEGPRPVGSYTMPEALERSELLVNRLRKTSKKKLQELMGLSLALTRLNAERYASWTPDFNEGTTRQALLAFKGDVYRGMDNGNLTAGDLEFAQQHLRILSGLHGMLRPLDLIKPYRLEMGTRISVNRKKDLYAFWEEEICTRLNTLMSSLNTDVVINLASNEYFKAVNLQKLKVRVITPVFMDLRNGQLKVRSMYAKLARGMMTGHLIRNRIDAPEDLKLFEQEGYRFTERLSGPDRWVFTR